jgi:predicted aspartyl protease
LTGRVDEDRRALVDVRVGSTEADELSTITVWIDTAFNGCFVFPNQLIDKLGLQQVAATEAILADGNQVTLESYVCFVDSWNGSVEPFRPR